MKPKEKRYWSGNGKTYVIDKDGFAEREATKEESKEAEEQAWSKLWDDFGYEEYED